MTWRKQLVTRVAASPIAAYHNGGPPAAEPTAFAACALAAAGKSSEAKQAADWLASLQSPEGAVGVLEDQDSPAWTTSLAILAWRRCSPQDYNAALHCAVRWAFANQGETMPRQDTVMHDTSLKGWSWAPRTHSWLEPTAFFVRALRESGAEKHPRSREGVRVLVDRLLPTGGCNYGNTFVLGQQLLPHLQPTGIVLWALEGCGVDDARLARSLDYAEASLDERTATASLAFATLGLAAHGRAVDRAGSLLRAAFEREMSRGPSTYKLALLLLASQALTEQTTNATASAS